MVLHTTNVADDDVMENEADSIYKISAKVTGNYDAPVLFQQLHHVWLLQ